MARQAHPAGPTEGGAAGSGGRSLAGSAMEGLGLGLGARSRQDSHPGGFGWERGGARGGFHPRVRIRTFPFFFFYPLKSKSYNL